MSRQTPPSEPGGVLRHLGHIKPFERALYIVVLAIVTGIGSCVVANKSKPDAKSDAPAATPINLKINVYQGQNDGKVSGPVKTASTKDDDP